MENRKEISPEVRESRRSLIKKLAYVAPIVLSLAASPSFARRVRRANPEPTASRRQP